MYTHKFTLIDDRPGSQPVRGTRGRRGARGRHDAAVITPIACGRPSRSSIIDGCSRRIISISKVELVEATFVDRLAHFIPCPGTWPWNARGPSPLLRLRPNSVRIRPQCPQDLARATLAACDEDDEYVLCSGLAHPKSIGGPESVLGSRRERRQLRLRCRIGVDAKSLLNHVTGNLHGESEVRQDFASDVVLMREKAEEQMLHLDRLVPHVAGRVLGTYDRIPRLFSERVEHTFRVPQSAPKRKSSMGRKATLLSMFEGRAQRRRLRYQTGTAAATPLATGSSRRRRCRGTGCGVKIGPGPPINFASDVTLTPFTIHLASSDASSNELARDSLDDGSILELAWRRRNGLNEPQVEFSTTFRRGGLRMRCG